MSTLTEIEAAPDTLPLEEKQKRIRFLISHLDGETRAEQQDLTAFSETIHLSQDPLAWQRKVRGQRE
jgi:hypothetical protein